MPLKRKKTIKEKTEVNADNHYKNNLIIEGRFLWSIWYGDRKRKKMKSRPYINVDVNVKKIEVIR